MASKDLQRNEAVAGSLICNYFENELLIFG